MPIKATKLIPTLSKNNIQNYHWILFLFVLMTSAHAFAQGSKVEGKVVDDHGNGITAVTVLIAKTQFKTLTDGYGIYEITIPKTSDNLIFSADGFINKEINRGHPFNHQCNITQRKKSLGSPFTSLHIRRCHSSRKSASTPCFTNF